MPDNVPSWGIVSTIRGSAPDILRFAAYHLDLGADRMYLYLDEPCPAAFNALNRHPRIEIRNCDEGYWANRKRERPDKHQVRQTANASFTYRKAEVDWLAHIDLDEFLWPQSDLGAILAEIPQHIPAVRVRPIEPVGGTEDLYKAYIPAGQGRDGIVQALYPNFGGFVLAGFLSHVQGKLFVRKGLPKINFRIHNLFQDGEILPTKVELPQVDLCHRHAPDWDHWLAHYRFRFEKGSYQPGMSPNVPREQGGMNMNELLSWIEKEDGAHGLRVFYDEISGADQEVRTRLEKFGLIKYHPLDLDGKVAKHFPGST
ncbi:glycosyltransferase family 2 protein [Ruegeria faecimaris]|uniref:glycosyltransferase family 2 protein n=1 Tax=Ruegeria faecimaris TaxID=686389 RepID=UPI0024906AE8|nr:glycosyltransferase family 2 protein [Ruegeria faecimaris]